MSHRLAVNSEMAQMTDEQPHSICLLLSGLLFLIGCGLLHAQDDIAKSSPVLSVTDEAKRGEIIFALRGEFEKNAKVKRLLERDADVKQRFDRWVVLLATEQLTAQSDDAPSNPALREELVNRMKQDQDARKHAKVDAAKIDKANQVRLEEIIAEFGWPGRSLVGADGARAAWIIAQHADRNPEFQARCLKLMQAVPRGEVSLGDLAYLIDRVRRGAGKPQMYGTQLDRIDGELVLQAVDDEEGLNQRRAEMALMPMEVYLLFASEAGASQ